MNHEHTKFMNNLKSNRIYKKIIYYYIHIQNTAIVIQIQIQYTSIIIIDSFIFA